MMARDRTPNQTIRRESTLVWLCICLAILVARSESLTSVSSSAPKLEDAYGYTDSATTTTSTSTSTSATEEETSLAPSTERTSNAIPDAEQSTSELLKKYNAKKLDKESILQSDQLDKAPYPYLKKITAEKEDKENAILQTKRSNQPTNSDSLALNGTLKFSISQKTPLEPSRNVESTTTSTTTTTESSSTATTTIITTTTVTSASSTAEPSSEPTVSTLEEDVTTIPAVVTTLSEDETTYPSTSESTASITERSSVADTDDTESATITIPFALSSVTPLSTLFAATTSTVPSTDVPTTVTDLISTTIRLDDAFTTPVEKNSSALTTSPLNVPLAVTIATTEAALAAVSTGIVSVAAAAATTTTTTTTTTLLPVTTLTTTSTSTSTTTVKPLTTFVPAKNPTTSQTTTTSEAIGAITTWQDETSEPTTEIFSPTPASEDVTVLVRIVLEGNWQDVCSKLPILRQSLTDLLNGNSDKPISARQIIFHQTQCSENLTPTSVVTDTQLTPVLVYVVDANGNFDGKLTKILPNLYESSPIDFPLKIHSVTLVPEADSGNAIAVVIVSCVAFVCLILLAGLLFIMRKRQGRFNYGERCRPVSLDAYSLDSVSAYNSVRRSKAVVRSSKRSYGNPAFEDSSVTPTHPLNFAGLSAFCNDANAVADEFAGIPQIHSKIEELPPGAEIKNRYANVIPLPETRVPLQRINNDPLSEYINASYVRGPKNATKYYIACQAPTEATVADFWRLIWEQQCKVIIMLTDLVENGVDKCTEYIPPLEVSDCHRLYGDYQVTLKKREAKEKYAISTLHLKNLENNTFREVSHIWYLWPASGVPADAAGLIAVLLEARALQRGAVGPILVHCSPGTGRTGTLIALDLCIRQYEVTRTVDVPRVVYTIRRDRAGAVQTREQYLFLYKGLNLYASKLAGGGIDST